MKKIKRIKITQAANHFFDRANYLSQFFFDIISTAEEFDKMRIYVAKSLANINGDEPDKEDLKHKATYRVKRHIKLIREIWLCRLVECYENYLSSILKDVFLCCPDILKSSETVKIDEILKYDTMEEFVKELTERKVSELSYSSFDDLFDFFDKKLKIKIIDEGNKGFIREAIETRNISTHNDCVINKRYISKLSLDEKLLGCKKVIQARDLAKIERILYENVKEIDTKLINKFKIENCIIMKEIDKVPHHDTGSYW